MLDAKKKEVLEWVKSIIVAIALALIIRALLLEVFLVQGDSMMPTLRNRERLIVSKVQYYFQEPSLGEIVVFQAANGRDFIKRVIGTPGDRIEITRNGVVLNGKLLEEPYVMALPKEPYGPVVVPENTYFVMGDNRNNSMDSRHPGVGFINEERLKGKAVLVFWPPENIRIITHP